MTAQTFIALHKSAFDAFVAQYVEKWGQPKTRERRKLACVFYLTNGRCRCFYCDTPLDGGQHTSFDHENGDGAAWRDMGLESRDEIQMILEGTHPEPNTRKFACLACNNAKGKMSVAEFAQTEYMRFRRAVNALIANHPEEFAALMGE